VFAYFNYNHFAQAATSHVEGSLYFVYSLTCPHCSHLKDVLPSDINITYIPDTSSEVQEIKERLKDWTGGVPLLVCFRENEPPLVMIGYPSESQDKDGYLYSKEKEEELCGKYGEKVYENGEYIYCKYKNSGYMMGNKNALQIILDAYRKGECV